MGRRWAADPRAAVQALVLEAQALAFNPRMRLFGSRTARQVAESFGLHEAIAAADAELAAMPAAMMGLAKIAQKCSLGVPTWLRTTVRL